MKNSVKFQTSIRKWRMVLVAVAMAILLSLIPEDMVAQRPSLPNRANTSTSVDKENPDLVNARARVASYYTRKKPATPPQNAVPDAIYDKSIPGVIYLGRGYDVFLGGYADTDSKSLSNNFILDIDKLLADGQIGLRRTDNSYEEYTEEEDIRKYSQAIAGKRKIDGNFLFFQRGNSGSFGESYIAESSRKFANLSYFASIYILYINEKADLSKYLSLNYKKDVEDAKESIYKYDNLILNYGTHLLTSLVMGGRIDHSFTWTKDYIFEGNQAEKNINTSLNYIIAKVSDNTSVSTSQESSDFKAKTNRRTKATPAIFPGDLNEGNIKEWFKGMCDKPTLCGFESNSLYPVVFFADKTKLLLAESGRHGRRIGFQHYLKAYTRYAENHSILKQSAPIINCITGIGLYSTIRSRGGDDRYEDKDRNTWEKIGIIGGTNQSPSTAEHYLYVLKGMSSNDKPPVVEVFFNVNNVEDAQKRFNEKYKGDPSAKLHSVRLINGNNGDHIDINMKRSVNIIELYYVTSINLNDKTKPLKNLKTSLKQGDGKTYYYPDGHALVKAPDGFYRVNNAKGNPQDSAEGSLPLIISVKGRYLWYSY